MTRFAIIIASIFTMACSPMLPSWVPLVQATLLQRRYLKDFLRNRPGVKITIIPSKLDLKTTCFISEKDGSRELALSPYMTKRQDVYKEIKMCLNKNF